MAADIQRKMSAPAGPTDRDDPTESITVSVTEIVMRFNRRAFLYTCKDAIASRP